MRRSNVLLLWPSPGLFLPVKLIIPPQFTDTNWSEICLSGHIHSENKRLLMSNQPSNNCFSQRPLGLLDPWRWSMVKWLSRFYIHRWSVTSHWSMVLLIINYTVFLFTKGNTGTFQIYSVTLKLCFDVTQSVLGSRSEREKENEPVFTVNVLFKHQTEQKLRLQPDSSKFFTAFTNSKQSTWLSAVHHNVTSKDLNHLYVPDGLKTQISEDCRTDFYCYQSKIHITFSPTATACDAIDWLSLLVDVLIPSLGVWLNLW